MDHARWIGFAAFFVSSLVIGLRLLALARRTGQIPELLIGIAVLCLGPLGYGLALVAFALASQTLALSATLMGTSLLATTLGTTAQYLFIWTVFRRDGRWAKPVLLGAITLLLVTYVGDMIANGLVNRPNWGMWFWLGSALRIFALGWGGFEALRYYRVLSVRVALGLADPVVAQSFLMWGLGSASGFTGGLVAHATRLLFGREPASLPLVILVISLLGLVSAVAMWLAFLPTPGYLRWIERRSRKRAAIPSTPS